VTAKLLTVQDVAERLAVSPRTVKRVLASGELPVVRLGRAVRIREEDLRKFLAARTCAQGSGTVAAGGVTLRPGERLWD
jgi:excisionase family DNA binding protein